MTTGLRDLIQESRQALRIPEINGERCVHSVMENATCTACVDACPTNAWVIDDEIVGIKEDVCDGCGLCAPICSEGAILHDHEPVIRQWRGKSLALTVCEKTAVKKSHPGCVPCVHALGLRNLFTLYQQGSRLLFIHTSDCSQCSRGSGLQISDYVQRFNQWLKARQLPPINIQTLNAEKWLSLAATVTQEADGPAVNRRAFLRGSLNKALEEGMKHAGLLEAEKKHFEPPGVTLNNIAQAGLVPWVPEIDDSKCNGCDACVNLCPHQSITLEKQSESLHYEIDASLCTGCNVCVELCERDAVTLLSDSEPGQVKIPLSETRCKSCGVTYHLPDTQSLEEQQCQICSVINHHKNLYQVLE